MKVIKKRKITRKWIIILGLVVVLLILIILGCINTKNKETDILNEQQVSQAQSEQETGVSSDSTETKLEQEVEPSPPVNNTTPTPPSPVASQWPVLLTNQQAASITVIVNKKHKLSSSYVPSLASVGGGQLRPEAASALNSLIQAASAAGVYTKYVSGYRSYASQQQIYNNYVARDGQAAADTYSARPGHSEHQTGLAVDIGDGGGCDLETCFANTAAGQWAAVNAYKYGFVVRYPNGKDAITGYQYEPWHLRYLGVSEATTIYNSGKTLEEYYDIPGGGY